MKYRASEARTQDILIPLLSSLTDYCVQEDFIHPLPQTQPLDFFGLQTRQADSINISSYYQMQLGANDNIYFYIFHNQIEGDYQLLFQQSVNISDGQHTAKL